MAQGARRSEEHGARWRVRELRSLVIVLALLPCATHTLAAQTASIRGTTTDSQSQVAVAGVALVLEGTGRSGLSRDDGAFSFTAVPAGDYVLRAERLGYRPLRRSVTVSAGRTLVVDLELLPAPLTLDELVVTGAAGRQRVREVSNSLARLEIDDVTDRPVSVSDFLQGVAVGVAVTGGSGEAGQGKQIRLRGNSSMLLSNQPLVYIDGVRMMEGAFPAEVFESGGATRPSGSNVTTSPLDLVGVGDIARIEVFKGPAATTLFGTGASSGVIQIVTKRGQPGPTRWTADISQGTGWVRPVGMNGVNYLHVEHFLRDAWWGGGYEGGEASRDCVIDDPHWEGVNKSAEGQCSWPGAQWYQTYRMAVEGGSQRVDYFASAEYQNDTYALPLDHLERVALRTNLGASLSPRVETRLQLAYSHFTTSNTASGSQAEGILLSTIRQDRNYLSSGDPRDIVTLLGNRSDQRIDRFTGGLSTTFSQNTRMSHRLTLGYDFARQDLQSLHRRGAVFFPPDDAATTRRWDRLLRTVDYLGSYELDPGHELRSTLSFGAQAVADDVGWVVRTGVGFGDQGPTTPTEAGDYESFETTGSTTTTGVFAQNVLALSDRYFLTTGLRIDRFSTSDHTSVQLGPRLGLAWVVSDEAFWPGSFGAFKTRAAYGRSSSAPNSFVQAVEYIGGEAPADAASGGTLEPELTSEWEVGFDWTLLGGRLALAGTGYHQTTTNALVPVREDGPLPQRQELQNIGKLQNQGIELQVDAAILREPDWTLDLGLGISTNKSKVLDLGGVGPFRELAAQVILGHPVPVSAGRRVADPDAVNGPWSSDRYLSDEDGNLSLPIGPQLPTNFLNASISVGLPGGIAVAARGEYRGGNVRYVNPVPIGRGAVSPACLPYYVDPATSLSLRADTPDLWQERCDQSGGLDYWFDADYFKLRSVTASLPIDFAFPRQVDNATLTVTLANAFTWYREVPWWDLEIPGNGGANDDGLGSSERVPAPTTIVFGMRVRF